MVWTNTSKNTFPGFVIQEDKGYVLLEDGVSRLKVGAEDYEAFNYRTDKSSTIFSNVSKNATVFTNVSRN